MVALCIGYTLALGHAFFHDPAPKLPTYLPGDTFNYVNDRNELVTRRVARIQGDFVDWETETSYRFTSFRSFFLPRVRWDGENSTGSMVSGPLPNLLWPLKPGTEATVKVRFKRFDKKKNTTREYEQTWACKVYKKRPVTVPAGTFDAIKVICRYLTKKGRRSKRLRSWYYSPTVGHYIKRLRKYRDRPKKTFELVSFRRAPRN